jgi:ADP-ribose pyrophosphatase
MAYELLNRKVHFTGRVFTVAGREYRLPDGRSFTYDVVEHHGAITVVPVDKDGCLLFVRQYRVGSQSELLELPAGMLEDDEDPLSGAAREVREEIGMGAGKMERLGDFYMAPGYSTEHMHVFLATNLYPAPLPQDQDEFLSVSRIPARKALEMARGGQIHDGKTLAALLMAEPHLNI